MQLNDVEVNADGSMAVVGHSVKNGAWTGSLVGVSMSGSKKWSQDYGNYGGGVGKYSGISSANGSWVYNECWGVAPSYGSDGEQTGYVLACGTGIECEDGANNVPQCSSDPRRDWRGLLVGTDMQGERVWSRMDNMDNGSTFTASSASEYVFALREGGHVSITDEAMGFGFASVAPYTNVACSATTTLDGGSSWQDEQSTADDQPQQEEQWGQEEQDWDQEEQEEWGQEEESWGTEEEGSHE